MEFAFKARAKYLLKTYGSHIKKGDKILDVGCGNGVVGRVIQEKTGCTIMGTDTEKRLAWGMPFTLMKNDTKVPFADKEFDVAMLNGVMHHVPYSKQAKLLRECVRVAAIVLMHEDYPRLGNKVMCWAANIIHHPGIPFSRSFRAPEGWEELFTQEGSPTEKSRYTTPGGTR